MLSQPIRLTRRHNLTQPIILVNHGLVAFYGRYTTKGAPMINRNSNGTDISCKTSLGEYQMPTDLREQQSRLAREAAGSGGIGTCLLPHYSSFEPDYFHHSPMVTESFSMLEL